MRKLLNFIKWYFFALFSCLYIFTLGFFKASNRTLVRSICRHFGFCIDAPSRNKQLLQATPRPDLPKYLGKELINEMNSISWWHRIEVAEGLYTPGKVAHGSDGSDYATARFGMPESFAGKTVLDVGSWDGYFSFEAEKRGARKVLACDISTKSGGNWAGTAGFNFARKVLNSKVEFRECAVEDLIAQKIKTHDVVLCYGVLYHLPNLLPALANLAAVTGDYALIETAVLPAKMDNSNYPLCAFLNMFDGDPTNYWYPNEKCLTAMLKFAGFREVECVGNCGDTRITLKAYK